MNKEIYNNKIEIASNLVYRNVKFSKIDFAFKKVQFGEDDKGIFNDSFDMHVDWEFVAEKSDRKGIIIGCHLKLLSSNLEIELMIQTKMEFDIKLSDEQIFNRTSLQILSAKLFFPYLMEIISANTAKMGITPIALGYDVLDRIIAKTNEQGGFAIKK